MLQHNPTTSGTTNLEAGSKSLINRRPKAALVLLTVGALVTAAATSVAAKNVFSWTATVSKPTTYSSTKFASTKTSSTTSSVKASVAKLPKTTATVKTGVAANHWSKTQPKVDLTVPVLQTNPADCVHYACVGDRLKLDKAGGGIGWVIAEDLTFDIYIIPDYLTLGGNLMPKNEPEYGESGYSNTYYGRVDPLGERTTLSGWKTVNGFDSVPYYYKDRARYINAYDLGFGRDMNCYGSSCYVTNYLDPKGLDGGPTKAATVTMERMYKFGRTFIAFYVYDASGQRVNRINLDSEGPKSVPESCNACHKGYITPGGSPAGGAFLPWDLDLLEDWPGGGRPTVAAQKDTFRRLNKMVWNDANTSYSRANFSDPNDPSTFTGYTTEKRKQSLVDLIEGWYGGAPYTDTNFNSNRLPKNSWYSTVNNSGQVIDSDDDTVNCAENPMPDECVTYFEERSLYKNVYEPYCRACHVTHGPNQDAHPYTEGREFPNAATFKAYAEGYICNGSNNPPMPHAELTDHRFKTDVLNFTNGESKTPKEVLCGVADSINFAVEWIGG